MAMPELARRVALGLGVLPVVIPRSSVEQEDNARRYDLAAKADVRKPVVSDAFSEAVDRLEAFRSLVNESLSVLG